MMMLWLKWIAFGALALVALSLLVLFVGAQLSLDRKRQHSAATAELPRSTDVAAASDGLVVIPANGFEFRARVANLDGNGDAVVLLHGFPQSSAAWEPLIRSAAERGYRVVAFDQRGYSPGARPADKSAYSIDKLMADVLAVADALGFERFHLVGHDWGAAVGWGLAMQHAARLRSWSALSIPHSYAFGEALRTDPEQRKRSRYFLLFRMPGLAEWLLSFNDRQVLRSVMYRGMSPAHQAEYLGLFAEPGALTGALNWYRAVGLGGTGQVPGDVELPVLFVWGNRDPAVARRSVELQGQYIKGPFEELELDTGHWLLERRPEQVVDAVLAHWARQASAE